MQPAGLVPLQNKRAKSKTQKVRNGSKDKQAYDWWKMRKKETSNTKAKFMASVTALVLSPPQIKNAVVEIATGII